MLIFKCVLLYNELTALQKYLPPHEFCIITRPGENVFYGVMNEELHSKFMDNLSGETLEQLEYLDEKELRNSIQFEDPEIIGNEELLKRYL